MVRKLQLRAQLTAEIGQVCYKPYSRRDFRIQVLSSSDELKQSLPPF